VNKLLDTVVSRFLLCGGLAAACNWFARMALSLVMPFELAVAAAYVFGMTVGYCLYRSIVWRDAATSWRRQLALFVIVNAFGAVLVLGLSVAFVEIGSMTSSDPRLVESLAHGLAIAIGAFANFLGHHFLTFARKQRAGLAV
jgi:putative flippase GtrA